MSKFKEFYLEFAPIVGALATRALKGYVTNKISGAVVNAASSGLMSTGIKGVFGIFASQNLRRIGLDNKSLNILTNNRYFQWNKDQRADFEKDYSRFLNLNRDLRKASQEERLFAAMQYFKKSGRLTVTKNNPYANLDFAGFSKKLGSNIKNVVGKANDLAKQHGNTAVTILKAMK